tara:strand:+ start:6952 stop:8028 length:1077 start_codon:yes stop_codon:yes gene_type:complete
MIEGYKPLQYFAGQIILARGYDIFIADYDFKNIERIGSVPASKIKKIAIKMRKISRLLRLDVGPSFLAESSNELLICSSGLIYVLDIVTGEIDIDFVIPRGSKPLNLVEINVPGFSRGIYFGEYLSNPNKTEVRIYRRQARGRWEVAYKFADGEINHIHAIVPDKNSDCVYILTGDFGQAAAIWKAEKDFSVVRRVVSEGQASRACWMAVENECLHFATDTQLDVNYLTSVSNLDVSPTKMIRHTPILGSSIYSLKLSDGLMVFSTAVEPDEVKKNKFLALFSTEPGPGIISNRAAIYVWSLAGSVEFVFSAKKDILPFRLFQFGSFHFPAGPAPMDGCFHAYGVGLNGYDNVTLLFK